MTRASGVGDILAKSLSDMGLYPKAQKYKVFSLWPKIVGDIARYAAPRRLSGEVLFVATASSVWSQELYFMRDSILAKINQALGGQEVRDIRFSEHMWAKDDSSNRGDESLIFPGDTPESVSAQASAGEIRDAGLSEAFRKVARTLSRRKQHLLSKGFKLCRTCGCVYPGVKRECPSCRLKREFEALTRAIAILDKRPHLRDQELAAEVGLAEPRVLERARRQVESRLVSFVRNSLAAEAREAETQKGTRSRRSPERIQRRAEVAEAIRRLAALRAGTEFASMSPEEVDRAVGRRYAALSRKG
ncbi:MAG: DciA family protein [Bacillota bacterium]